MAVALVTGANGFIGAHLVKALVERDYHVRCLVRGTSDLTSLHNIPGIELHLGDVRQPDTLVAPVQNVDIIFHLSARLMVADQDEFFDTNLQGTINLLDVTTQHAATSLKRFLFVSSQAAMGPNKDDTPVDETIPPAPISWYGTSKAKAEEAVMARALIFPVTIVRPSAVYGERETELSQMFPVVNSRIHPAIGFKKTGAVLVYVGDLVKGIIAAAESSTSVNQTYFLNHPQPMSTTEVAKTVAQAIGKPSGLLLLTPPFLIRLAAPLAEFSYRLTRSRPPLTRDKALELTQSYWIASPDKARRDFGWEAEHSLLDGMRKTTQFYFEQQRQIREMALENKRWLWIKYVFIGIVLGTLIEITSALGGFYAFEPGWLVIVVILFAFGLVLGSAAMLLRQRSVLVQFVVGTLLTLGAELPVALDLLPFRWVFAPGFPFGITDIYLRSVVLAFAGGMFVIVVNLIMQSLYKRRLRLG
jgi:nucleoside-diphosphate-sugar epimerase